MDANAHSEEQPTFPLLRIWLCGPFQAEWIDPMTGAVLPSADLSTGNRDRFAALALLALLLCQPNRQAHRDWLMEQFWPESGRSVSVHRMENIFSYLRKLLRPPTGEESLAYSINGKKGSGPSYGVASYPSVWVDRDALIWQSEQAARMERFGDDSLPYWERAHALLKRGPFLADEPYDAYADWLAGQRSYLEGYERQCVHALSRLYRSRYGEAGKAEALLLLRTYWLRHKTDEDALRPLMELLGEQERYQEAEDYYQQLLVTLADLELGEKGRPCAPDPRTQDIREYLRTKQIQHKHPPIVGRSKTLTSPLTHLSPSPGISQLAAFDPTQPIYLDESSLDILTNLLDLTNTCRKLSDGNELYIAERMLWAYLPRVESITKLSFEDQQKAADIASQGYLLAASLAGHRNDLQARKQYSEQALLYGKLAQDRNLQVVALRQLAITFDYLGCPDIVLRIYQRMLPFLSEVYPLLQSCIYADISGAYTQLQRQKEAEHYLDMAYEHFTQNTTQEPEYLSTICRFSTLILCKGLNRLAFGQAHEAEKVFAEIDGLHPKKALPERIRIDLLNCQVETFLALRKMDQVCTYLETAVKASLAIGSKRRFQETTTVLQLVQNTWPYEQQVRQLADFFIQ